MILHALQRGPYRACTSYSGHFVRQPSLTQDVQVLGDYYLHTMEAVMGLFSETTPYNLQVGIISNSIK